MRINTSGVAVLIGAAMVSLAFVSARAQAPRAAQKLKTVNANPPVVARAAVGGAKVTVKCVASVQPTNPLARDYDYAIVNAVQNPQMMTQLLQRYGLPLSNNAQTQRGVAPWQSLHVESPPEGPWSFTRSTTGYNGSASVWNVPSSDWVTCFYMTDQMKRDHPTGIWDSAIYSFVCVNPVRKGPDSWDCDP
jgi:hypothetical protein